MVHVKTESRINYRAYILLLLDRIKSRWKLLGSFKMFMAMYSSIIVSGPQYLTHIIGSVFGLRVYGPLDASERPIIPKHNLNYSCNSEPAANILRLETQDTSIPPSILFHPISPHPTSIFFLILIRPCTLSVLSLSSRRIFPAPSLPIAK